MSNNNFYKTKYKNFYLASIKLLQKFSKLEVNILKVIKACILDIFD